MREQTIKCDVCGKVKGEGNKWLIVFMPNKDTSEQAEESITITNSNYGPSLYRVLNQYRYVNTLDICSDTCLQKELGKALERIRKG